MAVAKSSPYATTEFKGGSATSTLGGPAYSWFNGSNPASSSNSGSGGVNPLDLSAAVNDLLGFDAKEEQYKASAEGARLTAQGAQLEAEAYGKAGASAEESAKDEALLEGVRQVQISTQVDQTLGDIKANVAGSGFQQSGSALDILASSTRQGYLSQQISAYQSVQTQRGHLEQAAAAEGEQAAALTRGASAEALAAQYDTTATSAAASSTAMTAALTQLLSGDENAQQLTSDLLAGNTANLTADVLLYNPAGADQPLATSPDVKPSDKTPSLVQSGMFG